ncbi:hypothetical protein ACIGXM_12270 [Kitasatospora sp. NPDC052896]|uniref:hypothetical protein n=1 Tax=Kitasatospora sp. NPDC052896 TaxID=3364061 RepID=UPI0037CA1EEE
MAIERSPEPGAAGEARRTCGVCGRRALLAAVVGAAVCAAGCGGSRTAGPTPRASARPSTAAGPSSLVLPATRPWLPGPGEIQPDVKLRAVQLVEALGAWPAGGAGPAAARARVAALGLDPGLADQAGPLLPAADRAALQVIDAQYGGILSDSASVLVVCDQWTATGGGPVAAGGTTVDVRLGAATPRWRITALHPARPGPPSATLSGTVSRALAEPRLQLSPASLADLRSGLVHDSVARAMLTLAQSHTLTVSVVRSGHPLDVFGTDRPSDHPLGRAFDVWRIDGRAVVDPATPAALVDTFMRAAAAAGSYNVGGPRQLSGGSTPDQFFTDATHHDHVHVGFLT